MGQGVMGADFVTAQSEEIASESEPEDDRVSPGIKIADAYAAAVPFPRRILLTREDGLRNILATAALSGMDPRRALITSKAQQVELLDRELFILATENNLGSGYATLGMLGCAEMDVEDWQSHLAAIGRLDDWKAGKMDAAAVAKTISKAMAKEAGEEVARLQEEVVRLKEEVARLKEENARLQEGGAGKSESTTVAPISPHSMVDPATSIQMWC